jgi:hypothetical protein
MILDHHTAPLANAMRAHEHRTEELAEHFLFSKATIGFFFLLFSAV